MSIRKKFAVYYYEQGEEMSWAGPKKFKLINARNQFEVDTY